MIISGEKSVGEMCQIINAGKITIEQSQQNSSMAFVMEITEKTTPPKLHFGKSGKLDLILINRKSEFFFSYF